MRSAQKKRPAEKFLRLLGIRETNNARLSPRQRLHIAFCLLCLLAIIGGIVYIVNWQANLARVESDNARYRQMYAANGVENTPLAASEPPQTPAATPGANTLVMSLPSAPPIQESFAELLRCNPDTVGYLAIGDLLALPVVQRENDNEYYLTHNFEGKESKEGTLFLDGMNRLALGDMNLIVYGHNMRNETMFGKLDEFHSLSFLRKNCIVNFDTLYENAVYAPFAAFSVSMDRSVPADVALRQFTFNEDTYSTFVAQLKKRSLFDIPIEAYYGDQLLLLVTCDHAENDGRFVLALRRMHPDETEEELRQLIETATRK